MKLRPRLASVPSNLTLEVRNQGDEPIGAVLRGIYVANGKKGIGRSRLRIPAAEAGTARNMKTVAELARELE